MIIIKSSGENVPFDPGKFRRSLERVGAASGTVEEIFVRLEPELREGITTKRLYQKAFNLLKTLATPPLAAKYKIKNAIMELGPSGYSFEKYISRLLSQQGYECAVGMIMKGKCVQHEVDVVAKKENRVIIAECKFHNHQGKKCDVKIPLYVYARFKDLEARWNDDPSFSGKEISCWIITNTRFSEDAIEYGNCMGIHLIGWDYPSQGNLRERIHLAGLYPVTSMTCLTRKEKKILLEKEAVLCRDIVEQTNILAVTGFRQNRINNIIAEAKELCGIKD
ncbi:MAG: restriction endonuclease [Bacteroidetes bacterium]|nr:restriction endonuclease [Bacteroidota bacterium]